MTDKHAEGNADAQSEESAELSAPTLDDFKVNEDEVNAESEETENEEVQEEAESEEENEHSEDEEESEEGEVLSQELDIDQIPEDEKAGYLDQIYDSLDDEKRREWLSNREGRVGKDMGKMRGERAEAIKRAEIAEAKVAELQSKTFEPNNPFSGITDVKELEQKAQEVDSNIAAARKFLRSNEDYLTIGEKEYDRETIDGWLDIYLAQKEAIPRQRERINNQSRAKETLQKTESDLASTYDWMKSQSGEQYEAYDKMMKDPKWSMILDVFPELSGELPKVLAKYVSTDTKAPKKKLVIKGKRNPKGDLGSAGTARTKKSDKDKALERLRSGSASERDSLAMFM